MREVRPAGRRPGPALPWGGTPILAYAPSLWGAVIGLAVIVTLIAGLLFLFRALPWSRPGPWSWILLLACIAAMAFLFSEAAAFVTAGASLNDPRQLAVLGVTAPAAAILFLLNVRDRQAAFGSIAAEARQRDLIAALPNPVFTTDADGIVTSANPAAVTAFGERAVPGRRIDEILPFAALPKNSPALIRTWRGAIADRRGRTIDAEVSLSVVLRPSGASGVYVLHDVSEHATASRLREQLLYSVAHELRQPLTVLYNALDILSRDYQSLSATEFEELLASSRRTVHRLRTLMEQLLSAGSIESGRFVLHPRPTALRGIVEDAVEVAKPDLERRRQRVEVGVGDIGVLADARYAQQVIANLLANASKYGPEGQAIEVSAVRDGGVVRISVKDHGPGIAPEHQAGLFERFYRVPTAQAEPGVGLGLAIAKGIVEAHGGHIGVVSDVGAGTVVWFTLPLARLPAEIAVA